MRQYKERKATPMYTVSVKQDFTARHELNGGARATEGEQHSHHYVVEVRLEGLGLDQQGYLVDIEDVNTDLLELVGKFSGKVLNDMPEFKDQYPSLEQFARVLHAAMADHFKDLPLRGLAVRLRDGERAWAGYSETY